MKKILLGLVAAFALSTFAAPAFAGEEAPPAGEGAKAEKPAKKKGKKAKKEEGAAGDAAGAPPAEKPAK